MRATTESVTSYLRYRVWNGDALKRFATIDMAKIHIKSEKLTPFGGIFLGHGAIRLHIVICNRLDPRSKV